ncbi:hypothetical protein F5Y06DRAFT_149965 [Hypoxylon sp. FL0890]|nr:hypothetical protein F5Y06DRAFT_149965 [Hypoxylon sp. FL0890]
MSEARKTAGRSGVRGEDNERGTSDPNPEQSGLQDVAMVNSPVTMTPAQTDGPTSFERAFARPVTRSMTSPGDVMMAIPYDSTSFRERLRRSSKKPLPTLNLSGLEESKSITYDGDEQGDEPGEDEDNAGSEMQDQDQPLESPALEKSRKLPETGQLRTPIRRSVRLNEQKGNVTPLDSALAVTRRPKKTTTKAKTVVGPRYLRRSPRLAKPLTEFHLFDKLPLEIKMMIWEFAIKPRLVYIRNRPSLFQGVAQGVFYFGRQNPYPSWFMTCHLSAWVAQRNYQKRFAVQHAHIVVNNQLVQDFNTVNDIVVFEPCHGACRGYHCARHQYREADRSAVRFLAVQTESRTLPANTEPCWQSIARSWPNVETLYLMRVAVRAIDRNTKAMIRVQPDDFELRLESRFEEWKKGAGKDFKISKLEFVVMVPKENTTTDPNKRYRSVEDRLTGLPEDIILE